MGNPDFRAVRDAFFDRWRERHPEEASTLGVVDTRGGRLSDPSLESIEAEADDLRATLRALAAIESSALDREERLDRWSIESWAKHEVRRVEDGAHLANVELGLLPYHLLRHFLVHAHGEAAYRVATARIGAIPRFLAAHERTLSIGVDRGARAHAGTTEWIASRTLPAIARAMETLPSEHSELSYARDACAAAGRAFEAHARFLAQEVLPAARTSGALGEETTRFRLAETMGLRREPAELVREAKETLELAHARMIECAARVGARVPSLAKARDVESIRAALATLYAQQLASSDAEVIPAYERLVHEATYLARRSGLVPPDLSVAGEPLAVKVAKMPPAIAEAGHAQNWAAPLVAGRPRADFLVRAEAAVHPAMAAPLLAVHEGVPGHSLQSLAFAHAHSRDPRPVRFLAVADDVAMARSYFGAMLSIEGWATWVEERMRELGFYEGAAELYACNVRAIRAVRVIADLGIHLETITPEDAHGMLMRDAFLPAETAATEVARYQRIPLQAVTYLTGALAIERHLAPVRKRGKEPAAIVKLLAEGPIPPEVLASEG